MGCSLMTTEIHFDLDFVGLEFLGGSCKETIDLFFLGD